MERHGEPELIGEDLPHHVRHDADDRVRLAVDRGRGPDDACVGGESTLPDAVREHHDLVVTLLLFEEEGASI